MEITTEGLVIAKFKFKESSNVVVLFTLDKGIIKGILKGGSNKKNVYLLQLGNLVNINWHARLEEHLGILKLELKSSSLPNILNNMPKLLALKTACELLYSLIPEKDSIPTLYESTVAFFSSLALDNFFNYYIKWEISLLKHLGYGLDFSKCAVCNKNHELTYVSPKTGAAVCAQAGEAYKSKLLVIPKFFNHNTDNITLAEKKEALALTGYFIERIYAGYNKAITNSRKMLLKVIS